MKDVLLPIGSIVKVAQNEREIPSEWMIIGKRVPHPDVCLANDYAAVPFPEGFNFNLDGNQQVFYFDHYEIDEIVMVAEKTEAQEYRTSCNHKECPICNHEEETA